jgi:hypothetical protein
MNSDSPLKSIMSQKPVRKSLLKQKKDSNKNFIVWAEPRQAIAIAW